MCNNDAVLWKRQEKVGFDHKMLWFEGKKWDENRPVFARFFCPFLKMHSTRLRACRGKKVVLGVIWRKTQEGVVSKDKNEYSRTRKAVLILEMK